MAILPDMVIDTRVFRNFEAEYDSCMLVSPVGLLAGR